MAVLIARAPGGIEIDILLAVLGRRLITPLDLEAGEIAARDDIGDAGNSVGAIERRGPVLQDLDALNHVHRQRVDVDELRAVICHRRRTGHAATIDQGQRGAEAETPQIELRRAEGEILVGAVEVELRAGVGGDIFDDIGEVGRPLRLDVAGADHLQRRRRAVALAPDIGAGDHDLLEIERVGRGAFLGTGLLGPRTRCQTRGDDRRRCDRPEQAAPVAPRHRNPPFPRPPRSQPAAWRVPHDSGVRPICLLHLQRYRGKGLRSMKRRGRPCRCGTVSFCNQIRKFPDALIKKDLDAFVRERLRGAGPRPWWEEGHVAGVLPCHICCNGNFSALR